MNYPRPEQISVNVLEKEHLNKSIIRTRFQLPKSIDFLCGQFCTIFVNDRTRRSYSIASQPGTGYFETIIDISPNGPGSNYFKSLNTGDTVEMVFPLGRFVYIERGNPVYFLATGAGIAPFISMIDRLFITNPKRLTTLLFGVRSDEDIFLFDKFDRLQKQYQNFNFKICLSKPNNTNLDKERYYSGRITKLIQELKIDKTADFYISGGHEMIKDNLTILKSQNIPEQNIFTEQYY